MREMKEIEFKNRKQFYDYMNMKLKGLICEEPDWLANLANASALLWLLMEDINWAGFYLYKNGELVLGPFQGKPACTRIALDKGVCGSAATARKTLRVENVHDFPGHIACDSDSLSEIVIPIIQEGKLKGVLDIDSPILSRFDGEDEKQLKLFVETLNRYVVLP